MTKSGLEILFAAQIEQAGLPEPVREHRFHPTRKFQFDFSWPELMVAVEIEGGTWLRTRTGLSAGHAHPKRFEEDCEKYAEALILGWRLLRVTGKQVRYGDALLLLERLFESIGHGKWQ